MKIDFGLVTGLRPFTPIYRVPFTSGFPSAPSNWVPSLITADMGYLRLVVMLVCIASMAWCVFNPSHLSVLGALVSLLLFIDCASYEYTGFGLLALFGID